MTPLTLAAYAGVAVAGFAAGVATFAGLIAVVLPLLATPDTTPDSPPAPQEIP